LAPLKPTPSRFALVNSQDAPVLHLPVVRPGAVGR
jgi:hypothetical protein